MALRFADSFDHYQQADITMKWTAAGAIGGTGVQVVTGGRYNNCLKLIHATSANAALSKTLDAQATWIVGFAFQWTLEGAPSSSAQGFVRFVDVSTVQVRLDLNADGTISVVNGDGTTLATSTSALSETTWYYVEFKATIGNSGTYQVKVNEVDWIVSATGDTQNSSNSTANVIRLYGEYMGGVGYHYYDDVYICDSSGTTNNDFLGDVRVEAIFADADSATNADWTCSAGSDHYALVDESATDFPDDDTTYVSDDTAGHKDTYGFPPLSYSDADILGVQLNVCARKDDAGARSICGVVRSGGSDTDGDTISLGNSYTYIVGTDNCLPIWETDPATAVAWTLSGVEDAEFGVKLVT